MLPSTLEGDPILMSMRIRSSYVSCCVEGRDEVAKTGKL